MQVCIKNYKKKYALKNVDKCIYFQKKVLKYARITQIYFKMY